MYFKIDPKEEQPEKQCTKSKAESRANQHICEPKSKRQYALHINVKSTEIK